MPHVVLLAWSFPPISDVACYRPLRVAKTLVDNGWEVTVASAYPTNTAQRMNNQVLERFIPAEVRVVRLPDTATSHASKPSSQPHSNSLPARVMRKGWRESRRLLAHLQFPKETAHIINGARDVGYPPKKLDLMWHTQLLCHLSKLHKAHPIDLLWATMPPTATGVITYIVGQKLGIPYLLDYRDLWIENPFFPAQSSEKQTEKILLDNARTVTAATQGFADVLGAKTRTPVKTIYNGFDPEIFAADHTREHAHSTALEIVYAGTLYNNYPLPSFADALISLGDKGVFHLYGGNNAVFKQLISQHPKSFIAHGFVLSNQVHHALRTADIALVIGVPDNPFVVPAKTYEALALRKPVLYLGQPHDETARILEKCGLLLCASCESEKIETALQNALLTKQQGGLLCHPHETALMHYSVDSQAASVIKAFKDALQP